MWPLAAAAGGNSTSCKPCTVSTSGRSCGTVPAVASTASRRESASSELLVLQCLGWRGLQFWELLRCTNFEAVSAVQGGIVVPVPLQNHSVLVFSSSSSSKSRSRRSTSSSSNTSNSTATAEAAAAVGAETTAVAPAVSFTLTALNVLDEAVQAATGAHLNVLDKAVRASKGAQLLRPTNPKFMVNHIRAIGTRQAA